MPFKGQYLIVKNRGLRELKLKNGCLSFPCFFWKCEMKFLKLSTADWWEKTHSLERFFCFSKPYGPIYYKDKCTATVCDPRLLFLRIEKTTAPSRRRWDHGFSGQHGGLLSESCSFWWSLVAWHETQVPDVGKQACFSRLILYFTVFLVFRRGSQIDISTVE